MLEAIFKTLYIHNLEIVQTHSPCVLLGAIMDNHRRQSDDMIDMTITTDNHTHSCEKKDQCSLIAL